MYESIYIYIYSCVAVVCGGGDQGFEVYQLRMYVLIYIYKYIQIYICIYT